MTRLPAAGTAPATCEGNMLRVLQAAAEAVRGSDAAALAVVLETEGSTYSCAGTLALFTGHGHTGWLSGGCLEPEIERRALAAAGSGRVGWLEIDTRDDAAFFTGAAIGCRGRQRLALLPLNRLDGVDKIFDDWLRGQHALQLEVDAGGQVQMETAGKRENWCLDASPIDWDTDAHPHWSCTLPRPPHALILGSGPEVPTLAPLLRDLGWRVGLVERRPRWRDAATGAGDCMDAGAAEVLATAPLIDAALVMHHNFEMDRDALEALAGSPVPFIGLLGPPRRRDDLFRLLSSDQQAMLEPRLHSPVGLWLGGRGPESIALSIAAQLQQWRHPTGADMA